MFSAFHTDTVFYFFSNWSFRKRAFTTFSISLLTFGVYIGSAIYTPAIPGIMQEFGVSLTKGTLGLTLYILGKHL
jgi:DHA1 family multidrug resistance protein-like MFS transporter